MSLIGCVSATIQVPPGAWTKSPACIAEGLNATVIKEHFVLRVAQITLDAGLHMAAWEDGFYSNGVNIDKGSIVGETIYATVWDNVWEWGSGDRTYVLANNGYKV